MLVKPNEIVAQYIHKKSENVKNKASLSARIFNKNNVKRLFGSGDKKATKFVETTENSGNSCNEYSKKQLSMQSENVDENPKIEGRIYQMNNGYDVSVKMDMINNTDKRKPTVFVINRLSGPQLGDTVLQILYSIFNPLQVIDLVDEGLSAQELFLDLKNLHVVVGGGDGTIASIASFISDKNLKNKISVIPCPLGTGNDLSRNCGWGIGISDKKEFIQFLDDLLVNDHASYIDRWSVSIEVFDDRLDKGKPKQINSDMYLYLGIGLDAKISYEFSDYRKKYTGFFKSRVIIFVIKKDREYVCVCWMRD